jgi:O-Antigen ligase
MTDVYGMPPVANDPRDVKSDAKRVSMIKKTPCSPIMSRIRTWLVGLVFIASFMSTFQPAPCDYVFIFALLACLTGGLRMTIVLAPLLLLLLIYNFAGLFSYILIPDDQLGAQQYILGLAYTSMSGVFIAAYLAENPAERFQQIIKAYWVGATIGSALALIGYFNIQPIDSLLPEFSGRALGAYKDPNVFSTWLVLPIVSMLQGFMLGTLRLRPLSMLSFLLMFAALFLSFSRGAWFNTLMATSIMIFFTFSLSPSNTLRMRITYTGVVGITLMVILMVILLSVPETREVFLDRFTLVKNYDAGETGRFGNQLNSLPILLSKPLGLGPYQFGAIYGLAPHNTFLNSFSSGGWIGGISFIAFVICTFIVGFKTIFVRTPFQPYAIVAFAGHVAVSLQGVQIDTEHWRHLYWMVGMVWGFHAASYRYMNHLLPVTEIFKAWNVRQPQQRQTAQFK